MESILKREYEVVNMVFKRRLQEAEVMSKKIRKILAVNKEQAEAHLIILDNLNKKINESVIRLKELKQKIIEDIGKDFK